MRVAHSLKRLAAALSLGLLPFGVLGGGVYAQNTDNSAAPVIGTIENTAEATWEFGGNQMQTTSNTVIFDVTAPAAEIRTYRPAASGGTNLAFRAPLCRASGQSGQGGSGGSANIPLTPQQGMSELTNVVRAGQTVLFEVTALAANSDPEAIDQLDITITSSTGDREIETIFETGVNTGVFVGQIGTVRMPPAPEQGDCRLSILDGSEIAIEARLPGNETLLVEAMVEVLIDPFGVVFDSETGELVNGASVTLINASTGQPATVFAEDGVTSWPSTVISGQSVTDGNGNVTELGDGEFWFPLTMAGTYRLEITPPDPYSAPSIVSPDELARLTRPDGRPFVILDASFGDTLTLSDPRPVQVDIPLDRAGLDVGLVKTASRDRVQPGDVVFYSITAQNPDPSRTRRSVVVGDTPSSFLRLRPESIRVDGEEAPDSVAIAADGSSFSVALGDIAGGSSRRVTYAMTVRNDAPPGRALNDATVTDSLGRVSRASAVVDIERESIADRMTIIGRVVAGTCSVQGERSGIAGIRLVMEDGSYAITDADGRYHFEGVVPGSHVVAVAGMTLPDGAKLVNCNNDTRNAGSASSRFVIGQGGSLAVADFYVDVPASEQVTVEASETAPTQVVEGAPVAQSSARGDAPVDTAVDVPVSETVEAALQSHAPDTDWLALGDGEDGFLTPSPTANPRAPAIRVAIRHRRGQTITLKVNGEEVNPLNFDGTLNPERGRFAVSTWRGVLLENERTLLEAEVTNSFGVATKTFTREVFFTTTPTHVELVPEQSNLVADGRTRPVIAVRILDRNNRPLREGVSGNFQLNAPYESAESVDRQQINQLTGFTPSAARWVVEGEDGIARIELAPTMVSGSLRLDFAFKDGDLEREQQLETWIEPGDIEWTIVGLIEGTAGARSVAENMEREGRFDSDLGDDARVALYAKGRVLGRYLLTLAYDSAKQREDQRLLGTIDPQAYYTVFGDASSRRFDAASQEKLYVRIETSTFYALYGDFETAFDQTRLARYNRTATGIRSEARFGQVKATAFAADVSSRLQRDEIQGQGISGPYQLSNRLILANSETVTLEVRDRFRSELIVSTQSLTRFIDYDVDLLSGTITFKRPILSRDDGLNPQFIIVEYETEGQGSSEINAGIRADWTSGDGRVRVGVNAITDKGDGERTNIGSLDLRAQIGDSTEVRGEIAASRSNGETATGWLAEVQHQTGDLDILAYARQLDADYGVGQQNGVELGRRKFGIDGRVYLDDNFSITGSVWQDDSLIDISRRRAAEGQVNYTRDNTDLRLGLSHFDDRLADGTTNTSTVLEGGATHRLFNNALEVSLASSIALDDAESVDLPARHRIGLRYNVAKNVRLVGTYEIADGETFNSRQLRAGIEATPWQGGQLITSLGQETIGENGNRTFAAFGLAQTLQVTPELTLDATIDGNRTLNGVPSSSDLVNPGQPASSGGQLTGTQQFEDFTAFTLGAAWRKDRWSATVRGEYRDGEEADRTGVTFGAIRQLGEGSIVGSGLTWTRAEDDNGASTEILDANIAFAHRPDNSALAMLGKLEYRSDQVVNGVAGSASPVGNAALNIDGDATARRLVASWSTNWTPNRYVTNEYGKIELNRNQEYALFVAGRYNLDEFEGTEFSGTTLFVGADVRFGIGDRFEIGASATVRSNLEDEVTSYSFGPQFGFVPVDGMLLTVGYNVEGFRDGDFSAARNTDKGVYAAIRYKFDTNSFEFLGLGR